MSKSICLLMLLCSAAVLANPTFENDAVERPPLDCSPFSDFISNEVMTLSYTASLGEACVTIESTLFFDASGTASEWDAEGNVLSSFSYEVADLNGQCVLSSPVGSCGAQILAFNNDNSALTLTADGEDASLTPVIENLDDWGIFQTYAILNDGSSDAYYAGGANPDNVHPAFGGVDLGNFSSSETLTLNGGEIKTYKNNSANVCGGNTQYRVYADGDTPGSFNAVSLAYNSDLGSGDQKWSTTNAGIDLLDGLTLGDYTLEIYWDADGDTYGGCGFTNTENNAGANYLASFSLVSYGCTDNTACNYDASATIDDSSCESLSCAGCTDNTACNYDASATIDDSSCESLSCAGCTDNTACNYDASATIDDSSCESLSCAGCTDNTACNYDASATIDDSSCESLSCAGCTDNTACNYDASATIDDSSCESLSCAGCTDNMACNYDASATIDDSSCESLSCAGCTDNTACNYDASATIDDSSCESLSCAGCTDNTACNYDASATIDDSSCESLSCAGCTDNTACNYDASATIDDSSCESLSCAGCTDSNYAEYDASATVDDGSCLTTDIYNETAASYHLTISEAINSASTDDVIVLAAASFSPSGQVTINKALTLKGAGSASTTINGGGASYAIAVSADGVHLEGFTLNGAATYGIKVSKLSTSILADFSMTDVATVGTANTGIDLNGVDGATLTNISASNAALGYGLAIASSADVTVDGITTSANTYGAIGIFPAQTQYQDAALEAPANIVIEGAVSLNGGAGAITAQNGALNSGGTWVGTVSNDEADNADVTVPTAFTHALFSTRNDGVTGQSVAAQAVIQGFVAYGAANPVPGVEFEDVYIYDMDNGDYEVIEPLLIQDAIDAASAGDEINVADGTYEIATTLDVNKGVTLVGESMAGTILDASAMTPLTSRVMETNADNIALRNLTIKPITDPDAGSNNSIGFTIKAGANNGTTINDGLVMENISIDGAAERTPFDFHGLDNVTLTNLNASGTTRGNGMQITGCTNVTLNSFTGTSNAWGGIAIYASRYVPAAGRGSDNITIDGSGLSIDGAVFSQNDLDPSNGDLLNTNITVSGWDFLVYNDEFRGGYNDSEEYTFFAEDETAAVTLALGLNNANTASSAQEISTSDWIVGDGMAIAPAMADASSGQNVEVRAGTYEEDLSFDKALNINGPNAGIAHDGARSAEAIIDGEHTLSASGAVMLDGLQFLSNNSAQTNTIYISTAAGHTIQNNQFVSSIAGGSTGGQNDLALYTATLASGTMTISENSFSGNGSFSDGDRYSSAAWGRGIWFNGGGAAVTISDNDFTNCRTGMNLEAYANGACSVDGNTFTDCGTGMALGVPTAGTITSITNNSFQDVDSDINARNLTAAISWDLAATGNSAVAGNSTYYSGLGAIPGNSAGDIDDPNGNLAYLSGSGADRLIFGGEDINATGDYGGAANDYMDGGAGTNFANYGDNLAALTLTAYGDTLFVASPTAGNDTLVNFGSLVLSDQIFAVVLGCMDASADNYDASANVENLSCQFLGCTTTGACNFDSGANTDDGTCEFTSCAGCRDGGACNYDPAATLDGPAGTCTYPATYYVDCDGNCLEGYDLDNNGTCDPEDVLGCMNGTASNYNAFATVPDGSCQFEVVGCIQPDACNYNPDATIADVTSTCIFPSEPYLNCQGACLNDADGDGTCDEQEVPGCENPSAANYNPAATDDDGSCIIESAPGCLIPSATNYDPTVTVQGLPITSFCTFNFQNPPMIMPPPVDCADIYACNYDNTASGYTECEYTSCLGCTSTVACNYDNTAVYNDGSCEYTSCAGCTASGACNYDATASINDGACEYTSCAGCTEPNANNYDATATIDDASCEYLGCTNTSACNYGCADPAACAAAGEGGPNTDDGSCEFTSCAGCMTSGACNYDATATISAACEYTSCAGCMDNTADNYDATATIDDGTCEFEGCTNDSACNYDASANVDDGSCTYPAAGFDCNGDCLDLNNNSICDNAETPVPGCTNPNACNYDASATQNDGSCTVVTASASDITVQLDANGVASIAPSDVLASEANLIGHWTFEAGQEATDLTGNWGDLNVVPGDLVGGSLDLDPGDYYATSGYTGNTISEKTLMAWVQIEDLGVVSGSPISLNDNSGNFFDGIVYAERQANRFMSGSDNFNRTADFTPGFEETLTGTFVNVAITYVDEGGSTRVTGYRNGVQIGTYAQGTLQTWTNGNARIQFGPRHYTSNGNVDMLVEEARIYDRALTGPEIEEIIAGECTIASSTVAPNTFDVDDLGPNNAVLTVTDDQGNSDTDGFVVTVEDNIPPVASANDITIAMTSTSQEVILEALDVSTSTDNAGIESQTLSQNSFFGCDDVTTHAVTLTVVDFAGNSDNVTFNVTITHPDVDSDGICDDQDNCTDLTANNYNDPANGVCQPCGTAPVFLGLVASSPAANMTEANGVVTLNFTSGSPITLQLTGVNGTPDVTATIPSEMGTIPAGYYEARIIDADGCLGVASSPGGSTFGQPSVYYPLIMPYTQCCSGCGIYDSDTDGICDDSDNCINKLATNFADPANEDCIISGCTDPDYTEYDASANTDDGSCATLAPTCESPSMDGHSYGVVEIGDQCWFAENLRTTVYADGAAIPEVTDNAAWTGLSTGARCDYDNDASNVATYGRLYNWYAATDDSELCPTGWHVPTDGEWFALETYLGANGHSGTEATALKSTSGWNSGGNGTDDFGFSALPGGYRGYNDGNFYGAGSSGYWWSSSPNGGSAWYRALYSSSPGISRYDDDPRYGWSVRCLRDAD